MIHKPIHKLHPDYFLSINAYLDILLSSFQKDWDCAIFRATCIIYAFCLMWCFSFSMS